MGMLVVLLFVSVCTWSISTAPVRTFNQIKRQTPEDVNRHDLFRHRRSSDTTVEHVKEALYQSTIKAYIQTGQTQHIRCPSLRQGEIYTAVFWRKGLQEVTVARFVALKGATNFTLSDRYRMSDSHGLIIKNVTADDGDGYACRGVTKDGHKMFGTVEVSVLDDNFPREEGSTSSNYSKTLNVSQGDKRTIDFPAELLSAVSLERATVYWSVDIGENNYTRIIGVKFSNGEIVMIDDYHGNFTIAENGSLLVSSVGTGQSRLWYHLSVDGSGIVDGYVDVIGKVVTTDTIETTLEPPVDEQEDLLIKILLSCFIVILSIAVIILGILKYQRKYCFKRSTENDGKKCTAPVTQDEKGSLVMQNGEVEAKPHSDLVVPDVDIEAKPEDSQ